MSKILLRKYNFVRPFDMNQFCSLIKICNGQLFSAPSTDQQNAQNTKHWSFIYYPQDVPFIDKVKEYWDERKLFVKMCQFSGCTISLQNIDTVSECITCRASVFERFRDGFRNFDHVH